MSADTHSKWLKASTSSTASNAATWIPNTARVIQGAELSALLQKLYYCKYGNEWDCLGVCELQVIHTADVKTYLIVRQKATGNVHLHVPDVAT